MQSSKNKGIINRRFFLEGLGILLTAWHLENLKIQNKISDEMFKQMQAYAGIGNEVWVFPKFTVKYILTYKEQKLLKNPIVTKKIDIFLQLLELFLSIADL